MRSINICTFQEAIRPVHGRGRQIVMLDPIQTKEIQLAQTNHYNVHHNKRLSNQHPQKENQPESKFQRSDEGSRRNDPASSKLAVMSVLHSSLNHEYHQYHQTSLCRSEKNYLNQKCTEAEVSLKKLILPKPTSTTKTILYHPHLIIFTNGSALLCKTLTPNQKKLLRWILNNQYFSAQKLFEIWTSKFCFLSTQNQFISSKHKRYSTLMARHCQSLMFKVFLPPNLCIIIM